MKVARIIWFAIIVSTLLYGVLAYAAARDYTLQPLAAELFRPIVIVMYVIAVVVFALAFLIGARAERSNGNATATLIRCVLLESVAIVGLVAALVIHDWRLYLPAWALALVGLVRVYPRAEAAAVPS